jgi:hypothetical protein
MCVLQLKVCGGGGGGKLPCEELHSVAEEIHALTNGSDHDHIAMPNDLEFLFITLQWTFCNGVYL